MKYRQLTPTQRYQISALRVAGNSQRQIAAMLGCHNSTISREFRRSSIRGYEPERAQHQANTRRRTAFKRHKRVQWLTDWVTERLKEHDCRPKEIEHRAALGHWGNDTVLQGHKQSGLVTLVERRSGYLLAGRLKRFTANQTTRTVIPALRRWL